MGKKSKKEASKEFDGEPLSASGKAPKIKTRKPRSRAPGVKKLPASSGRRASQPTDEEIRLRAYFIAERRMQLQLEGDSIHDWMEARRQLIDEAGKRGP